MGLRALRYTLKHPDVFKAQLRALLRAGAHTDLRIMFPLVSGLDDFLAARDIAYQAMEELEKEKLVYNGEPKFGAMVELPSAVMMVEHLAEEANFLSIGSNDLVQYLLGVDRTNEDVEELYRVFHPAVLMAFKKIADAGRRARCPVSVCGDAAANPEMLRFFIGIGIDIFSVDPRRIDFVRQLIQSLDAREARQRANSILKLRTDEEVRRFLHIEAG